MNKSPLSKSSLETSAQKYFKSAEHDDTSAKRARKIQHAADASKITKLRELRLAKEAEDKVAADAKTAEADAGPKRTVRRTSPGKRHSVKMIF